MSKYKQTEIPEVDDKQFNDMPLGKLKKYVTNYFDREIKNSTVKNIHKGITVEIRKAGLRHLIHARNAGYVKLKAVIVLKEMIKNAEYSNFNEPDDNDGLDVLGYFNLKCKAKIEEKQHTFRIVIRLTKDGKFYYDHSVRVYNKKTPK